MFGDAGLLRRLKVFRAHAPQAGIFLDFDGTLSPIVDDPAAARPLPGVVDVISALADKYSPIAIVSGRPVEFLTRYLPVDARVQFHGLYGLQSIVEGKAASHSAIADWQDVVARGADRAEQELPGDVLIERKGPSFALHFRNAPYRQSEVEAWTARFVVETGLDVRPARAAVELGPFSIVDKGTTVGALAQSLTAACSFGDDLGDASAFRALKDRAAAGADILLVAVAGKETPQPLLDLADHKVDGPQDVLEALRVLAA